MAILYPSSESFKHISRPILIAPPVTMTALFMARARDVYFTNFSDEVGLADENG